jgi:hypothetical protein
MESLFTSNVLVGAVLIVLGVRAILRREVGLSNERFFYIGKPRIIRGKRAVESGFLAVIVGILLVSLSLW